MKVRIRRLWKASQRRSACSEGRHPNDSSVSVLCSRVLRSCALTQRTANWYALIYIFSPVATWLMTCTSLSWLWCKQNSYRWVSKKEVPVHRSLHGSSDELGAGVNFTGLGWQQSYYCEWVGVRRGCSWWDCELWGSWWPSCEPDPASGRGEVQVISWARVGLVWGAVFCVS